MNIKILYLAVLIFIFSCDSKPKVIEANENTTAENSQMMDMSSMHGMVNDDVDPNQGKYLEVVAEEVMQAERYTYIKVKEGNKSYWIATGKREAKPGTVYYYQGGLLKTNFESQEFNRTFDTLYLVSSIITSNEHPAANMISEQKPEPKINQNPIKIKDAISLKELKSNKEKYEGKTVTVSGECTKVNNSIMGKNWVHIKDGTEIDGKPVDLTISTDAVVQLGEVTGFKGVISLNKDLGYGYVYEVLMEEGQKVK